jgi:hypothetical protein
VPTRTFQVPGQRVMSRGDWAACTTCARLILGHRWTELLERCVRLTAATHPELDPDEVAAGLRVLWQALRRNRTGPVHPDRGRSDDKP